MKTAKTLLTAILLLFIIASAVSPAYAQPDCDRVPGVGENMVEAGLKLMSPMMVSPCIQDIVEPTDPASLEGTTVGTIDPDTIAQTGAIPAMSNNIAWVMSTKPVSSVEYLADLGGNIGLPGFYAYAQTGIGFNALSPVLPVWKAFRNFAYFVYVLIFVVIGFMIMFRARINPQTVVSLQGALPGLVITLVLITFSYAIAGLLIDLIYVAIYIPAYILEFSGVFTDASYPINRILNEDIFHVLLGRAFVANDDSQFIIAPAQAIAEIVQNLVGGFLATAINIVAEPLAKIIIGGIILFSLFKLFIVLGIGFIRIIFYVVLGPIMIMFNAIPGSTAFLNWARNLLADIAMFPAVAILFMIAAALMGPAGGNVWRVAPDIGYSGSIVQNDPSKQWTPPFLLLRGGAQAAAPALALVGLFAIMLAPNIAQMTRDALKVEPSKFGSAVGQTAGQTTGIMGLPFRKLWQQREANIAAERQANYLGRAIRDPNQ